MELGRFSIWLALFVLALSHCSEARHSMHRREADDVNYDDTLADEASDDDTQNDTDIGGDEEPQKIEIPATIETQPTKYEVTIGKNVRLECKVSPDNGTVVQWYKDNVLHFLGNMKLELEAIRYSIIPDSKDLLISDVNPEDKGVYRCEIVQTTPVAVNHTVVVLESPKIIRFTATNDGSVVEGSDLLLTCDVNGHPQPQIIWSRDAKNGNRRLEEKDGEFSSNSVFVKNVKREHAGTYYCYALNSVGHNQAEVKVVVSGKPHVQVHKTVVNSAMEVEAVLQCAAHDESTPHIRWYKDGRLIEDSSSQFTVSTHGPHSNLTVIPSVDGDFGTFTCEAENIHGKHNRSIELVQSPVIEDVDGDGPKLTWTVHSHQPLEEIEVQLRDMSGEGDWRRLSVPLPKTKDHKYEMVYTLEDKVSDAGKYEAVVKVKNNHSWSGASDPAFVDIEAQPQYIQHASVFRGNGALTIRPTITAALSTVLMYLLVRML